MYKGLSEINIQDYDLDEFSQTNEIIIDTQEENFKQNNTYKLLSLLCIALIDLGLIEIQGDK